MQEFLTTEFFGFLTGRTLLTIMHLFGVALGAGAAFFSDFLFTHVLKDRKINRDELGMIKLASMVVWIGLAILVTSGVLLFLGSPEGYLNSTKFLAKMSIIAILVVNGIIFHRKHFPLCESMVGEDLRARESISPQLRMMFVSGAVSGVSWASALILGALRSVPYSYMTIMGIYLILIIGAGLTGVWLHRYYFLKEAKSPKKHTVNTQQKIV